MPAPFAQTTRALRGKPWPGRVLAFAGASLLAGWAAWASQGHVAVYLSSSEAHLELDTPAHLITTRVPGRVIANPMRIGDAVHAGDLLLELDCQEQRLTLAEWRARQRGRSETASRIAAEIENLHQALAALDRTTVLASQEASSRLSQAQGDSANAARQSSRTEQLHAEGVASTVDQEQASATAARQAKEVETLRLGVGRLKAEKELEAVSLRVRLADVLREEADAEGQAAADGATVARLEQGLADCQIRAPVDGVIAAVVGQRPGAILAAGDELGTLLPSGTVRAVASFDDAVAGRIVPGQLARIRLDSYPWIEYGALSARVARVASEPRDHRLRVELELDAPRGGERLRHGLTGTVDIAVEESSPVELMVRLAGGPRGDDRR